MALTRRALGGLTVGGSAAFALSACGGNEGGGGSGKTEVTWAISSAWESWNETTSTGNNSYTHQAMTPMIPLGQVGYDFTPEGEVFYDDALFEGPPELLSEAPMQISIKLRSDAQWSDGNPVRLEDFLFLWYSQSGKPEHANQEKAQPASTSGYESIESIEQAEDGSIVVTYVEGYIDPEWSFTGGVYLPSHLAEAEGFDWQNDPEAMGDAIVWFNENLWDVVTGPYKPVDSKLGEFIVFEPNENYMGSVKPTIEKLTLKVIEGTESIVTELRQGSIDGSWPSEFSEDEFAKLEEDPALTGEIYAGSIWIHIDINTTNKFLADVELRKAVFTAIDTQDIIAKNFPKTEVNPKGSHFFTEASEYYVDHVGPTGQGSGDAEAARGILEAAGYTWDANDKLLTPDGEQVTFAFRMSETDQIRKTTAELTQAYLAEIGIDLGLEAIPDGELGAVLTTPAFDMVIFGWVGDAAFTTAPSQFFHSTSGSNFGKYSNPAVDEAIAKVRSTVDLDEAAQYANEVDALVVADAYVLPLFDEPQHIMWNTNVLEGVHVNPFTQAGPLYNIREWKIK